MAEKHNNVLMYDHDKKSMKTQSVFHANIKSVFEKTHTCNNNLGKSSITKINKHASCSYSMFTYCLFDSNKNNQDFYRCEDSMKRFCADLTDHRREIINSEKKEMLPFTDEENDSYNNQTFCHICKKKFNDRTSDEDDVNGGDNSGKKWNLMI